LRFLPIFFIFLAGSKSCALTSTHDSCSTGIVKALAQQLDAKVETLAGPEGTTVSITHATFPAKNDPSRLNGGHSLAAATNGIGDGAAAARQEIEERS